MVRFSICAVLGLWLVFPALGNAGCISEAKFEAQQPNHNAYVHTLPQHGGGDQISIYLKGTAFSESPEARFLEVTRKGDCIISIDVLTRVELEVRHQLYGSWSELEEGASNDNEGLDEGESSDDARSEDGTPDGAGNFENINVTALRDLYETYYSVEACHSARRGQRTFYISDAEMKKAQSAFKKSRDRILARNRSIDEQEVKNSAAQQVILFARVMVSSQQRYDNRHRIGCRQIFALFPPDLNKTVAREILPPAGTPNIGGGLIIPQDPRFRN